MGSVDGLRLTPPSKQRVMEDHDVDRFIVEFDASTGALHDFRLQLGRGYHIYAVYPAERGGRLWKILTDLVAVDIEPSVEEDPCFFDYGPQEWSGELGWIGPDRQHLVEYVCVEVRANPARYRCTTRVRGPDGSTREETLESKASI